MGKHDKTGVCEQLDDGRFNMAFHHFHHNQYSKRARKCFSAPTSEKKVLVEEGSAGKTEKGGNFTSDLTLQHFSSVPRMNVAILITGSRGDVQPFLALAHTLQKPPYSHRVRICTHSNFKAFVEDNGVEFFSIGGDPEKLMSYAVKNPGIMPSRQSMKDGDIAGRRADIAEMLEGAWRGCTEAGDGITEVDFSKDLDDLPAPFVADAIIANPPTYAHIHIAEKLAIPLHIMFTMPWSPTREFPHPLANLQAGSASSKTANYWSYRRMDLLTWEGLADLINSFRERTLLLDPITPLWGHELLTRLGVPFTYCWPDVLIPKPADWGPHISISGYWFLSMASTYKPDPELQAFLDAGPPPIYIGFGSIMVHDPDALTALVFEAVRTLGGWGTIRDKNPPENVLLLDNVPHDWLFPRVSAVVHHGGAGTTAIGISLGKPTVIVPFFGDQPWWGDMIYRAGAGPQPIRYKNLTAESFAKNIESALQPSIQIRAQELAERIKGEPGTEKAAESFSASPQMQGRSCSLIPDRVAVWKVRRTHIKLSPLAAAVLLANGKITTKQLKLLRHKAWLTTHGAQDPIVGIMGAGTTTAVAFMNDLVDFRHNLSKPKRRIKSKDVNISDDFTSEVKNPDRTASLKRMPAAAGKLAGCLAEHTLKAPVALFYNIANGFHNAPAFIYNDRTVRVRSHISDARSGIICSGEAFAYGIYDAVTGLIIQPVTGYKTSIQNSHSGGNSSTLTAGTYGIATGVGKGLAGLVLKTGAAVTGIPGYGLKGIERELEKLWTRENDLPAEEAEAMSRARREVGNAIIKAGLGAKPPGDFWGSVKHAQLGRKIAERRLWQGYRELSESMRKGEVEAVEREVFEGWSRLDGGGVGM
ncbi:hypothetical protein FKW77_006925 [Venturia effusa]|uniref:Uncharacterized protein n=1 Tax=Venturia effusa TaxID=50376 RepID=A0A517LN34_9PEZI|nr:hypothetical protein FKW77_006925 [Venturia effusa]